MLHPEKLPYPKLDEKWVMMTSNILNILKVRRLAISRRTHWIYAREECKRRMQGE